MDFIYNISWRRKLLASHQLLMFDSAIDLFHEHDGTAMQFLFLQQKLLEMIRDSQFDSSPLIR